MGRVRARHAGAQRAQRHVSLRVPHRIHLGDSGDIRRDRLNRRRDRIKSPRYLEDQPPLSGARDLLP